MWERRVVEVTGKEPAYARTTIFSFNSQEIPTLPRPFIYISKACLHPFGKPKRQAVSEKTTRKESNERIAPPLARASTLFFRYTCFFFFLSISIVIECIPWKLLVQSLSSSLTRVWICLDYIVSSPNRWAGYSREPESDREVYRSRSISHLLFYSSFFSPLSLCSGPTPIRLIVGTLCDSITRIFPDRWTERASYYCIEFICWNNRKSLQ